MTPEEMIRKSEELMEHAESFRIIDSESVLIDLELANYWMLRAMYTKLK